MQRTVLKTIPKTYDLEIRISEVSEPGYERYIDVREYVPSTGVYGRGILLPASTVNQVAETLKGIK